MVYQTASHCDVMWM